MSYDLFFKSRDSGSTLSVDDLIAFFSERESYEVTEKQAIYQNEITGVYFIFDFGVIKDTEQQNLLPVSFNLNYYRPHIFGLEAELELKQFVEKFNLLVSDPQIDGMGDGEFSQQKFISGWNRGNEFGYRAILQQSPNEIPPTLLTSQIEKCWRWNFALPDLQQKLGESIFVPRFMFLLREDKVATTIVWPDGIPIAIPEADVVFIPRKTILPKALFRTPEDRVVAAWAEVNPIIEQFSLEQGALPYRLLQYSKTPDSIVSQIRKLRPTKEKPKGVSTDKILNWELVAKVRSN